MKKPRVVLFDAYGTLFDVYSIAPLAEQLFPGQGQKLTLIWRDKQIEYTSLVTTGNHGGHYRSFWTLTEAALRYAIQVVAPAANAEWASGSFEDHHRALMDQYRHLAGFPETSAVLTALRECSLKTGILSNGDPEMRFVSSDRWDALAATWYGDQTRWGNRQNAPFEELGTAPHRQQPARCARRAVNAPLRRFASSPLSCGRGNAACGPAEPVPRPH